MESHSYSCWLMIYRFYRGGQSSWVICVIARGKGTIEVGCQGQGRGLCAGNEEHTLLAHVHLNVCTHSLAHIHFPAKHSINEENHQKIFFKKLTSSSVIRDIFLTLVLHVHTGFSLSPLLPVTCSYSDAYNFKRAANGIYPLYVSWERLWLILEETHCMNLCQR